MTRYDEFVHLHNTEADDCVLWPYGQNGAGYGTVYHNGAKRLTHRLSCEMAFGPAPSEAHTDVAHSCHTPACLNHRHLRWATRAENMQDRLADGTENTGTRNGSAKLSESDVRYIRSALLRGERQRALASQFHVGQSLISLINTRKIWRHI